MNAIFWSIALIIFIFLELITTALVSIWFVVGAMFALIASFLTNSMMIQVIVFTFTSFFTLLLVRPTAYKMLHGNISKTNSDAMLGKQVKLLKSVSLDEYGEVKLNGIIWQVENRDYGEIEKGNVVEIISFKGNHLIVKKVED